MTEAEKIYKYLQKLFDEGYEIIKYQSGCYAMQSYCDHTDSICDMEELLDRIIKDTP